MLDFVEDLSKDVEWMNEWMNEWKVYYLKSKETFINDNSGNCGKSAKG